MEGNTRELRGCLEYSPDSVSHDRSRISQEQLGFPVDLEAKSLPSEGNGKMHLPEVVLLHFGECLISKKNITA